MNYRQLFSAVNCQCIVIIEDDFKQGEYKKERVLYDLCRLELGDRECYLSEIEDVSPELAKDLLSFFENFEQCFDKIGRWEDCIPRWNIEYAFPLIEQVDSELKTKLEGQYNSIDDSLMKSIYKIGEKYGIGVDHPSYFDEIYNDYILFENRAKSVRIYTDFSAATQEMFAKNIEQATNEGSIVCIIDNYLSGSNRAEEIINLIKEKNNVNRQNIIGSVFSSKEVFEKINEKLYFEYVAKGNPERLKSSIAKSSYNYFISVLQKKTLNSVNDAFNKALQNKGIAFFLSRKAEKEGMSEFEIINTWIKLLSTVSHEDSDTVKRLIFLSKVINDLDDEDDTIDESLQRLNTLEAFDYTVNDYYLPVAAGDIFTNDKDEWFVLIGQDCDMARRPNKAPRNALSELLPAKIRRQDCFGKWSNDLKTASIYSFRKTLESESEIFQVDYQQRFFLANEIINLCAFNTDGQCCISLKQELGKEQNQLMPDYMITYYKDLQLYFSSVKILQEQAKDAFETVLSQEYAPRLVSVVDYDLDSDILTFNLKRVCRLTHNYVYYLYKLYLEYRGRQPFQTINLIRQEEISLPIVMNKNKTKELISLRCIPVPDKSNRKDYCWIVSGSELNKVLNALEIDGEINNIDKDELIIDSSIQEWTLSNRKKLILTKAKDKFELTIV